MLKFALEITLVITDIGVVFSFMGSLSLGHYHFHFLMILKEVLTFLSLSNPVLQYSPFFNVFGFWFHFHQFRHPASDERSQPGAVGRSAEDHARYSQTLGVSFLHFVRYCCDLYYYGRHYCGSIDVWHSFNSFSSYLCPSDINLLVSQASKPNKAEVKLVDKKLERCRNQDLNPNSEE